jgi:sterol desaturase/sphingolipid hydroxylase (fatty acid hydroxylase superfamily)
MNDWILNYEAPLRAGLFISLFILLAISELIAPRLRPANNQLGLLRFKRWFNNFSLIFIASLIVRFILPLSLVSFAMLCQQQGWGLFHQDFLLSFQSYPLLVLVISLLLLDLIIYWQHRLFHKLPLLWQLHKVHHSDEALDVSSGIRFHPLEIILSLAIKFLMVFLFGFDPLAILLFEVALNGFALFNHSNIKLPFKVDALIRKLIVTPDMHRIHHSVEKHEQDSNFGFNISIWDRCFRSYREQPKAGQLGIQLGLKEYKQNQKNTQLSQLLIMPFIRANQLQKR